MMDALPTQGHLDYLPVGAEVIVLQSHPAWVAAQRRARERSQAIHRHPSCLAQQRRIAQGDIGQPHDNSRERP